MSSRATSSATTDTAALDRLCVNTIRFLAVDAVEKAKSGHPGTPMGLADVAYVLWTRFLRYNPQDPSWPDRDRFVLSNGHASMLQYAMLHLAGYDLPLEELKRFRQWGSKAPGHPEVGRTPGIETTTGPLGQGFGNGVGIAVAAKMLAARFDSSDFSPITYRVFGTVSDGDLMEGVASEAASLAGHWGLGNLVYFYDDNHITIEGDTALAFSEDVGKRFEAYGWHVDHADPYDHEDIARALQRGVDETQRPTLIIVRTHIAYGAPHKQDTKEAHGEPLGAEEVAGAKRALGWPESPTFLVPDEVRERFAARTRELKPWYDAWQTGMRAWRGRDASKARLWDELWERRVPSDIYDQLIAAAPTGAAATRAHGNVVLQQAAKLVPSLVGGAGDLEPSTKTKIGDSIAIQKGRFEGRNFHFGIREHGMGAILNGLAAQAFIPYGASFLVFSDYARPAIRLSALMGRQVIWIFTHDSIFLGEDGPTHQPIEHLTALRAIPDLYVMRPADGLETAAVWALALQRREGPTLFALTRQNLPPIERRAGFDPKEIARGGYLVRDGGGEITIIATGSEVSLAVEAAKRLESDRFACRIVSMPCPQLFLAQDEAWRNRVLPVGGRRVTIEAGATDYWWRFAGPGDLRIGIDRFGESAPLAQIQEHFGFTPEAVAKRIREWL